MVRNFIQEAFVLTVLLGVAVEAHEEVGELSSIVDNIGLALLNTFVDPTKNPGKLCDRKCVKGKSRVCYFHWILEQYHAMGPACGECQQGNTTDCFKPQCIIGDGFQKGVMSINRQIPGPPLNLCEGDQVVIDIENMAQGTAAAIHWHGLHMVKTPYMDGTPYITQCPILFESTFRYVFNATEPGTHFYHSHSGFHKLNGQYGALIVRQSDENNPQLNQYDHDLSEHYVLISDWRHDYAENSFPGLPRNVNFPESLLINGRGTYVDKKSFKHNNVPVNIFYVRSGKYKFNLINAVSLTCTVSLQIQEHPMLVIATDSYPVEPFQADTLVTIAGGRYDFVIDANKKSGDYWIRIRGLETCQTQPTDSFALLRYVNQTSDYHKPLPPFPAYNQTYPIGIILNHPQASCFDNDTTFCVSDLTALEKDIQVIRAKPDYKFIFSFKNYIIPTKERFIPGKYVRFDNPKDDIIATSIVNNVSLTFPPQPILTQYSDVDKRRFCHNVNCPDECEGEAYRECTHIIKIKTGSIVEMALYDEAIVDGLDHPFHLHGFRFAVMGMTQNTTDLTRSIEWAARFRKNRPVWKDTVSVPMNGVVVARFRADNPGVWLMHCHFELHMATGMAVIFQVGEPEEWVRAPSGFPKCGNFVPGVRRGSY